MKLIGALAVAGIIAASTAGHAQTMEEAVWQFCSANQKICEDGNELARKMLGCLRLPVDAPDSFRMLTTVVIENGEAKFSKIDFEILPNAWEQAAATAVTDAITACEPYTGLSGRVVFLVTPSLIRPNAR
jgi:hypothetical protein